jgi:hypothetical protein
VGGALIGVAVQRHGDAVNEPIQQRAIDLDSSARTMLASGEVLTAVGVVALIGGLTWGIVQTVKQRRR